jgi:hypothetical protein
MSLLKFSEPILCQTQIATFKFFNNRRVRTIKIFSLNPPQNRWEYILAKKNHFAKNTQLNKKGKNLPPGPPPSQKSITIEAGNLQYDFY